MNGHDGVPGVVGVVEQSPDFGFREIFLKAAQGLPGLGVDALSFFGELHQHFDLLFALEQLVKEYEIPFQALSFLLEGL
jgi:hypothetical protein